MRRTLYSAVGLLGLVWCGFFVHACAGGPEFVDPSHLGDTIAVPHIQVGLSKAMRVEQAAFRVRGAYSIVSDRGVLETGESLQATVRWEGGLRINEHVVGEPSVRITPAVDGDIEVDGTRYRGALLVVADEEGQTHAPRVTLVNEVDLESYLKGVVGKEMSLSVGLEALKAQAIAARTYALYEVRHRTLRMLKGEKFDVYDDVRSQVYGGMERETELGQRVVDETRGSFVTWKGRLFKTFYQSTCGGVTEPARMVLGAEAEDIPPLGGTTCSYCEGAKLYRWTELFPRADVVKVLFPARPNVRIKSIRISKKLPRGHAAEVAILLEGASREVVLEANAEFRRKVDWRRIRSTFWESIELTRDAIVITGRGWGHGAGLCQVGAYRMADRGFSASAILEHYYPQARVTKTY